MVENTVKKTLLVDKDEWKKFEAKHPQFGAFTWFVDAALRAYNQINEVDPQELIDLAMKEITLK